MKKTSPILLGLLIAIFIPIIKVSAFSLTYNILENNQTNNVEAKISINGDGSFLKAIEGTINFDSNDFELINVIKSNNSSLERWGIEPYLIDNGELFFNGIFNSNLDGQGNELFNIIFKKNNENAKLSLGLNSATILTENNGLKEVASLIEEQENSIFNLISSTHPDSNSWYCQKKVKLNWDLPNDATKVKLLVDKNPISYPSVDYDYLIKEKEIELSDGIWYFHLRCFTDNGWSEIEHRKIMIDTQNPKSFDVNIKDGLIEFSAQDDLSQIEMYGIEIPELNQKYFTSEPTFKLSIIKGGTYNTKLRAYDKAGNYLERDELVEIKELTSPHFSGIVLGDKEIFILGYVDDPKSKVYASIVGGELDIEKMTEVSNDGKFVHSIEELKPGLYSLYLMAVGEDGISAKNKKAILIIDKEVTFNIIAKILGVSGLTILIIILVYIFFKNNHKKRGVGRPRKNNKKIKK